MAITSAICTSFKVELLKGVHDFTNSTGDTFKIALYTDAATLDSTTTVYNAANEASGTGYTAGGNTLVNVTPTSDSATAITSFGNTSWDNSTITARGALIYNASEANKAVAVIAFPINYTSSGSTFLITMPAVTGTEAIVRIN